jgi:hypothetical protein
MLSGAGDTFGARHCRQRSRRPGFWSPACRSISSVRRRRSKSHLIKYLSALPRTEKQIVTAHAGEVDYLVRAYSSLLLWIICHNPPYAVAACFPKDCHGTRCRKLPLHGSISELGPEKHKASACHSVTERAEIEKLDRFWEYEEWMACGQSCYRASRYKTTMLGYLLPSNGYVLFRYGYQSMATATQKSARKPFF